MSDGFTDDLLNQGYAKGYQQGRADAIDEMISKLKYDWKYINKDSVVATKLIFEYMEKLQEMRGQKNDLEDSDSNKPDA